MGPSRNAEAENKSIKDFPLVILDKNLALENNPTGQKEKREDHGLTQ